MRDELGRAQERLAALDTETAAVRAHNARLLSSNRQLTDQLQRRAPLPVGTYQTLPTLNGTRVGGGGRGGGRGRG